MTAATNKIPWQSTPEGRIKLAKAMKEKWAKKRAKGQIMGRPAKKKMDRPKKVNKVEQENSYIERFHMLNKDVDARISEINEHIDELMKEKNMLVSTFKADTYGNNE